MLEKDVDHEFLLMVGHEFLSISDETKEREAINRACNKVAVQILKLKRLKYFPNIFDMLSSNKVEIRHATEIDQITSRLKKKFEANKSYYVNLAKPN